MFFERQENQENFHIYVDGWPEKVQEACTMQKSFSTTMSLKFSYLPAFVERRNTKISASALNWSIRFCLLRKRDKNIRLTLSTLSADINTSS